MTDLSRLVDNLVSYHTEFVFKHLSDYTHCVKIGFGVTRWFLEDGSEIFWSMVQHLALNTYAGFYHVLLYRTKKRYRKNLPSHITGNLNGGYRDMVIRHILEHLFKDRLMIRRHPEYVECTLSIKEYRYVRSIMCAPDPLKVIEKDHYAFCLQIMSFLLFWSLCPKSVELNFTIVKPPSSPSVKKASSTKALQSQPDPTNIEFSPAWSSSPWSSTNPSSFIFFSAILTTTDSGVNSRRCPSPISTTS